ncbi:MAG: pilus assembly protein [Sphingomonadaceae bacterium]|nr:pilus assembly protein [Sphingomonadaceae bacterium]
MIRDQRGTAVIELAIVAPLLLMILTGITAYGGYFWMAHSIQQAANDGARASLAGLTSGERSTLATSTVSSELARINGISPANAATTVEDDGTTLSVSVRYDASSSNFLRLSIMPLPNRLISRSAVVRLGGL